MSYHLTWNVDRHLSGIEESEVPEGHGACDAILLASILGEIGNGKPLSVMFWSAVGTKDDPHATLDDNALFEIWTMLSKHLADSKDLGNGARGIARSVFEIVRNAKIGATR